MNPRDAFVFLYMARQARLCALACPAEAVHFLAAARYWLAMARHTPARRLP